MAEYEIDFSEEFMKDIELLADLYDKSAEDVFIESIELSKKVSETVEKGMTPRRFPSDFLERDVPWVEEIDISYEGERDLELQQLGGGQEGYELEVGQDLAPELDYLSNWFDESISEILRRSLESYMELKGMEEDGYCLVAVDEEAFMSSSRLRGLGRELDYEEDEGGYFEDNKWLDEDEASPDF